MSQMSQETMLKFFESIGFPEESIPEFREALLNKWVDSRKQIFGSSTLNNLIEQVLGVMEEIGMNDREEN